MVSEVCCSIRRCIPHAIVHIPCKPHMYRIQIHAHVFVCASQLPGDADIQDGAHVPAAGADRRQATHIRPRVMYHQVKCARICAGAVH
mmetsp:Transcript_15126/g.39046  ORF Transcript_15126/g.39046 Transcript_15126/m.39046 type:complete len:88 (-) Transcript_15126:340-603(-)